RIDPRGCDSWGRYKREFENHSLHSSNAPPGETKAARTTGSSRRGFSFPRGISADEPRARGSRATRLCQSAQRRRRILETVGFDDHGETVARYFLSWSRSGHRSALRQSL